jgi:glutathione S-transferase
MGLKLIIGNKNYSSWSLRPWIAMKVAGIAFDEQVISLSATDFKARLSQVSGTGKVPALLDGDVHVWESLAILEYVAEKYPHARLWPADPAPRALARAIAAEMHAGFAPLRRHLPMNAPVVSRLHTYAVEVGEVARAYMAAVMALPAWGEWRAAALAEPWVLPEDEVDWPQVVRV